MAVRVGATFTGNDGVDACLGATIVVEALSIRLKIAASDLHRDAFGSGRNVHVGFASFYPIRRDVNDRLNEFSSACNASVQRVMMCVLCIIHLIITDNITKFTPNSHVHDRSSTRPCPHCH